MSTRSPRSSHPIFPPLSDNCNACISFFPSRFDQKGIKEQCADPVTGSSKMVACGVKNLDTKSELVPGAVTITPPVPKLIWSNWFRSILMRSMSFWCSNTST